MVVFRIHALFPAGDASKHNFGKLVMNKSFFSKPVLALVSALLLSPVLPALTATEVSAPVQTMDSNVKPEVMSKYDYVEDGPLTDAIKLPTYQWMPKSEPKAIVIAVHGLTLHGRRYTVLARTFAVNGIGTIAFDMRGFGRCHFDEGNKFSTKTDNKKKVDLEKSYAELEQLAQIVKQKYPNIPLVALGESLGCTFCVRLAASKKDIIDGMILSAPAVKVNAKMYASPSEVGQGLKAIVKPSHTLNLNNFITKLVSQRQEVIDEMLSDPMVLKELSLHDLLSTDDFVETTAKWGKQCSPKLAVLIMQGGGDGCVAPKSVTDLMMNIPSTDQTLRWLGHIGHLQLETSFVRSIVIDAIGDWLEDHEREARMQLKSLEQAIKETGGTLVE